MKLSHFCWGLQLKGAVNFLAIYGLVMSIIGATVAVFLCFLTQILSTPLILYTEAPVNVYAGTTFLLLVQLGWFVFSYMLQQKNKVKDVTGVMKMIKIGSYIIGSVQVVIFALYLIFGIIFIINGSGYKLVIGSILTTIGGFFLIFSSLLLHGIRTKHSGKIKAWIIFNCVCIGLLLASCVLNSFLSEKVWKVILGMLLYAIILLYSSGIVIVHYNILLDDENLLGSALDNVSKEEKQY